MGEHYPLCERYISGDDLPCICELLSEHADLMVGAAMADLRAKVSSGWVPELDHEARIAVLALIEEAGR